MVGLPPYTTNQKREDVAASITHENRHVAQDCAVRDNNPPGNVWRALDDHYQSAAAYGDFNEADGHFSEVLNGSIGWFHLYGTSQNDLPSFHTRYEAAVTLCNGLPNPSNVRTKARELLQGLYTSIPFETMKRAEYDYHVRPPQ